MSRREKIEQQARHREPLCVSEWGVGLFVRRLGARKKLEMEDWAAAGVAELNDREKGLDGLAKFLILCVVEEDGTAAFARADLDWLKDEDEAILVRAFTQAMALNKMRPEDLDEQKKSSAVSPSDGSASSSAEPSTTAP